MALGSTTIATFQGIGGDYEPGNGTSEPAIAYGAFGSTLYDSDSGTGSTTYNLTASSGDSNYTVSFQIIAKSILA